MATLWSLWSVVAETALAFAQAVYDQWQELLGGSVVVWLLVEAYRAWQKRRGRVDDGDLLERKWVIAGILVLACFLAWHSEHQLAQDRPYLSDKEFHLNEVVMERSVGKPVKIGRFVGLKTVNSSERRPASEVTGEVIVLDGSLDPSKAPVLVYSIDSTDEIGPGDDFNIASSDFIVPSGGLSGPLYVFVHLRYIDAFSKKAYEQVFYKKWTGTQGGGQVFITTLFNVNRDERAKMAIAIGKQLNKTVPLGS